jgi:large-conductance mechanosensitive channel
VREVPSVTVDECAITILNSERHHAMFNSGGTMEMQLPSLVTAVFMFVLVWFLIFSLLKAVRRADEMD